MGDAKTSRRFWTAAAVLGLCACGCTSFSDWVHNGFKVGPNYHEPEAAVAPDWIDGDDPHVLRTAPDNDAWWNVFHDPELTSLIESGRQQNLDLKTAATRVLQAQAQRNIEAGNLFPQTQKLLGDYLGGRLSKNLNFFNSPFAAFPSTINIWATGFNASWELDFWGRLRRAVESANANLDASVDAYHDALVTLLADVATNYVQIRTFQERIAYARRNIDIQTGSLRLAEARLQQGKASALDVEQARSNLAQTKSSLPPLAIGLRQANDRLCVLLGEPVKNLTVGFSEAPIPTAPPEAAVGLLADLLHRRPDVRQALHKVAAQSAQIGVAMADLYPQIGVSGFIGYLAGDLRHLFDQRSFTSFILPTFNWKILNYGRIVNNIRAQDAGLQEKVLQYQQTVLNAGREVEDALEAFLQYQVQIVSLEESVTAAQHSVELVLAQYRDGRVDFNRVFTTQAVLVSQQDQLATARGNLALSLISVYRALGGGWQCFEQDNSPHTGLALRPALMPPTDSPPTD
jgi:NodT family efflux transporter outer membrane factor (OMF) lipoprotein